MILVDLNLNSFVGFRLGFKLLQVRILTLARMILVDGSNHAFRVHFALPLMHASDGFPTRALYGFTTMMARLERAWKPDYVAFCFDVGKTFRHEEFPAYKGHRPDMPADLRQQWPHFQSLIEGFGYTYLGIKGVEADDVIGTLAKKYGSDDLEVLMVTGDKDYCQLRQQHPHFRPLEGCHHWTRRGS